MSVTNDRSDRWLWLQVLVVGLVLLVAVAQTMAVTRNPIFVPSLILFGALLVPAAFVTYMSGRVPAWDIPLGTLALCALFGGVVGTVAAAILEYDVLRDLGLVPVFAVGLIEEAAKLIVPAVLLVRGRHRSVADGLVIGVAVGMGFAVLETMGYAFVALLRSGGNVGAVELLLLFRGLLSPAGHAAWTGLASAALWRTQAQGWRQESLGRFALVFVLVVMLHTLWDGFSNPLAFLIIGMISLALLLRPVREALPHRNTSQAADT
jgi:RsiW-degrading membrane proteinase PrsW (M82 family)